MYVPSFGNYLLINTYVHIGYHNWWSWEYISLDINLQRIYTSLSNSRSSHALKNNSAQWNVLESNFNMNRIFNAGNFVLKLKMCLIQTNQN